MGWNPLKDLSKGFGMYDALGSGLRSLTGGGKDPGKKQMAQILAEYAKLQNANKVGYANALAMGQKGLGSIQSGFTNALNATNAQASAARQGILDREKANLGTIAGGLADAGNLGSTVGANLQRGVYSDTNRGLTQVDSMFADLRAGLMERRAALEANQYNALAGLFQGQTAGQLGLGQGLISTIGSQQHPDPNSGLNALLQLGGQLGTAALFASDRRLKRNAVRIDGLEWEFEYVGQEGRYRGVMADEVPWAAHMLDGYWHVDYTLVPVKFRRVA